MCIYVAKAGIDPFLAILASIALGAVVGLINGLIVAFSTIPPFIVTLATMNISRGLARVMVNNKTVAVNNSIYKFIGTGYVGPIPVHIIFILIVIIITAIILTRTSFGRSIYAVGGNKGSTVFWY